MPPSATVLFVTLALSPFAAALPVAAQDSLPDSSPLSVATQFSFGAGTECQAGEGLVVQLHYTGTQPLRGYLIRFVFGDAAAGKAPQMQTLEEVRDPSQPMIPPGAEWTRTLCAIPKRITGEIPRVTATVDVLKFADDSTWGPRALPASHQLIGRLDGMDFLAKTTELQRFVSPIPPEQGPRPEREIEFQTLGPLRIESGIWRDEHGQEMLAAVVTNQSAKPIRGYLFTTTFFDPNTETRIRRASTKQLETRGNPSDYLAPGAAWIADPRKFSYLPDGTLASYKFTLDLVAFADGTTFGPTKSQESEAVLGMLDGIDAAKRMSQQASAKPQR
jgi:hypothetical protein